MLTAGSAWALFWFIIGVAALIVAIWATHRYKKDTGSDFGVGAVIAWVVGAVIVIPALIFTFPWLPQYHVLEMHTGKVVKVEARVVTDGNKYANITKEIAFWMEGETEAYVTNDVRLTDLKAGETLTVNRWDQWVYGGQNFWNVLYVSAPQG